MRVAAASIAPGCARVRHRQRTGLVAGPTASLVAIWTCALVAAGVAPAWPQAAAPPGGAPSVRPPAADSAAAPKGKQDRRAVVGNLVGHGGPIKAITVDPASRIALTGSFDYAAVVWQLDDEAPPARRHRLADHDGAVNALTILPGGRRALAAGDDGHVTLWDLETGRRLHRFEGHTAKIVGLALSPDGRFAVSASWDRTARVWDLEKLAAGPVLTGHRGPVNAARFTPDGATILTASYDGSIGSFASRDGAANRPVYKHGWGINVLEWLPGSRHLVFGALNGTVGVVDPASETLVRELKPHERPVLSIAAVDKPGLIATGSADGLVRVSRAADGRVLEEYEYPYGPIWALAFAPDGTGLFLGGLDDFATYWRVSPRAPFEPVETAFPRRFQVGPGQDSDPLEQGRIQFARKCSVCHTLTPDDANRAGPTLHGVFGRKIATLAGYSYSEPLRRLDIVWSEETIDRLFALGPDVVTPGSKMPLQKMSDPLQRKALIAYLKASTGSAMNQQPGSGATGGGRGPGQGPTGEKP